MNLIDLCICTENHTKRQQNRIFVTKVRIDLQKCHAEYKRTTVRRKIISDISIQSDCYN